MPFLESRVSFASNFVSLFIVMRNNFYVLFHLKFFIFWIKGAHQSASFKTFDCSLEIYPSYLCSFTILSFALPFSDMTHNVSGRFQLKHYILGTKKAHRSSNESSPNFSCHILNHKVRVYSNFTSLFRVMKDNSSEFFQLKPLYFG